MLVVKTDNENMDQTDKTQFTHGPDCKVIYLVIII